MATLGYRAEIDAGRRFFERIEPNNTIVLFFHGGVDGCCSGAIMYRTLRYHGCHLTFPVFLEKGETIYSDSLAKRALVRKPTHLIVMDTGSRNEAILPGITTMVIDHHKPEGVPPVDVYLTSFGVYPPEPSALLTYNICQEITPLNGLDWLAAVGTAGDMGVNADLEILREAKSRYEVKTIKETVALIDAARRSPSHDIATAFSALVSADSPFDITEGIIPESVILRQYRKIVSAEIRRAIKAVPKYSGKWAILQFSSQALVHPIVAAEWSNRLNENIVIAANYGYTEGNVHFSIRTKININLYEEIMGIKPPDEEEEFVSDYSKASGGVLPIIDFIEFLRILDFPKEVAEFIPIQAQELKSEAIETC
ncbi:MAG: hypothetical protein K6T99_12865 [Armatimonadetes bacterium]|nr:hypothetical protein [Armatimonadota bacterium]